MLVHFREIHALGSVYSEASADEILGVVAKLGAFVECEGTSTNLLVGLSDLCRLEGRPTVEHAVEDDADSPDVDFVAVALGLENLWSQVVWRSANSTLTFTLVENLGG